MSTEQPNVRRRMVMESEDVAISGSEFVGEKFFAIANEILNLDDEIGLMALLVRCDGYPEGVLGMAYPDTNSIAINLKHIWEVSCEIAAEEKCLSLRAILWINLMSTLMHDMEHIRAGNRDRAVLEESRESDADGLEEQADMFAKIMLVRMAQKFDIEPPVMNDMPYFATMLMDLSTGKDADKGWVKHHIKLMESGYIYHDPKPENGSPVEHLTYRDYLKATADKLGLPEDEELDWDQPTTAISIIMAHEDNTVEVVNSEPVAEPQLETAEAAEEAEVITEAQTANAMAAGMGTAGASVNSDQTEEPAPEVIAQVQAETDGMDAAAVQAAMDAGQTVGDAQPLFAPNMPDPKLAGVPPEAAVFIGGVQPEGENTVAIPTAAADAQAAAAAGANAQVETPKAATPEYPDNGADPNVFKAAVNEIYQLCYYHIFTKCDRQQGSDVAFASPANVLTPINISAILQRHGLQNVVMEYDTMNAEAQYAAEKCDGAMIRGTVMKKSNLPAYDLFLNFRGTKLVRRLVPQNSGKIKADKTGYTPSAEKARAGHAIMWIIDRGADKFVGCIEDNVYRELS